MPSLSTAAHATSSETLLADKLTECPLFESIDDSDSLVVRCALAGVQVKTAWTLIASAIFAARTTSLLPTAQASADAQVRGHEQQQQQHGQRPHAPSNVFTCSSVRIITSSRIIVVINNNYCCALHSALRADKATLEFLDLYRMDVLLEGCGARAG
jgi:hypothetical protein